jgi:hypothetical protein
LSSNSSGAHPLSRRRASPPHAPCLEPTLARAQLCMHRSARGYALAARTERARTSEFRLTRRSPARTSAVVSLRLPAAALAAESRSTSRRAQPWPATDGGDDACRARARARAGAGSWRAEHVCEQPGRMGHGGVSMTPQPRPASSTSSPAARENKEACVAVSGGVWRRAGVGLVMSPRGPKVLYGERFSYQKWCEWLTPRKSSRKIFIAPMHSSGRVASFFHTTFSLYRSRSAGILGQSRMVS